MDRKDKEKESYDERLQGTFTSVIVIGAFIILSWAGVFYYYWSTL